MVNRLIRAHRAGRFVVLLAVAFLVVIAGTLVQAQGGTPHKIKIGDAVTGTLNARSFAQVYSFDATAKDTVSISVTTKGKGLTLAVLLTDANGETLAQNASLTSQAVSIKSFQITNDGTYYITVMRGTGAQGDSQGDFALTLSGAGAAPSEPSTVTLTKGDLSVALTWGSIDDMNLEVRDPVAGEVNFRNTTVPSGGKLDKDVNASCTKTTADNPTETISWPKGSVPGGSYEIIVYFKQACNKPAAPQSFTITVSVDGQAKEPIRGTLNENQQYVASFILAAADSVTVNPGGADPNIFDRATLSDKITNAKSLNGQTEITGTINRNNAVDSWSFDGTANQTVTISMSRLSGSLDSLLFLLGPGGDQVAFNDDANDNTRDSLISNVVLPSDGRYVIIATRFGLQIGGTEGNYTLKLSGKGRTTTSTSIVTATGQPTTASTQAATQASSTVADGSIQISLTWNTRADMRLLVRGDPSGRSLFTDDAQLPDGATLTQQDNLNCKSTTITPQTNASWPSDLQVTGTFEVQVWLISQCTETIQPTYHLTIKVHGKVILDDQNGGSGRPDIANPRSHFVTSFTIDSTGATLGATGVFAQDISNVTDLQTGLDAATSVTYAQPVTGAIDGTTPFVAYSFDAKAGDRVRLSMRATKGNLDPFIFLLDPNRAQINFNDDISNKATNPNINSQLDQTITVDGTYYVIATRYGATFGGTIGSYELSVSLLNK